MCQFGYSTQLFGQTLFFFFDGQQIIGCRGRVEGEGAPPKE